MLLSAVSVLVVAQSSSEIPEGLMNNPVFRYTNLYKYILHNNVKLKSLQTYTIQVNNTATYIQQCCMPLLVTGVH